ncbi:hypothetical protein VNO77_04236 [Canavalia gladiata]|uniref:Uncharacterized protein n=1 Tax=Canavalia gladiata TaxID=3824 RepID=A0AAN9R4M7_CANGL
MSRGAGKPSLDDALSYVATVKETFNDEKEKFENFMKVMQDFQAERIDVACVKATIKKLFKGHRDLIHGFNLFLPKSEVILPLEDEQSSQGSVESTNLVDRMKEIDHEHGDGVPRWQQRLTVPQT